MLLVPSLLFLLAASPQPAPPPRYDASIREARITLHPETRRTAVFWTLGLAVSREVGSLPLRLAVWEIGPTGERRRLLGEAQYDTKAAVNCPNVNFCTSPMSACATPAGGCQVTVNGSCQTGVCDPEGDGSGVCGTFSCLCKVETKPCGGGKEPADPNPLGGWLDIGDLSTLRLELFPCPAGAPLDPATGACTAPSIPCADCRDVDPQDNVKTLNVSR
jgi:hypothetical protein